MLKAGPFRRLSLCFLIILLGLWLLPIPAGAEEQITLSSFEELRESCSDTSGGAASFLCTADDLVIADDIEIPEGFVITFRNFTVPEGTTLTVTEHAEIRTYCFTVQGTLNNFGKVVQQDLSATWADEDERSFALIPGHVENKGEMTLTDVFGQRNINRFGGKLTMYESALYEENRRIAFGDEDPPPVVDTPSPSPAPPEKDTVHRIFDILEEVLPRLAFFLVLACFFAVGKVGISSSRKEKRRKQGAALTDAAEDLFPFPGEDHFQRDKRKRIKQLDAWLKNGLIDRKEYDELKRRYREEFK